MSVLHVGSTDRSLASALAAKYEVLSLPADSSWSDLATEQAASVKAIVCFGTAGVDAELMGRHRSPSSTGPTSCPLICAWDPQRADCRRNIGPDHSRIVLRRLPDCDLGIQHAHPQPPATLPAGHRPSSSESAYSSGRLITIASCVLRAITISAGELGSGFSSRCGT